MKKNWQIVISPLARKDLAGIHNRTKQIWGKDAANRYSDLIDLGLKNLQNNPNQMGVRIEKEIKLNLYSYPLRNVNQKPLAGKVKSPRHVIYYQISEPNVIQILRILHDKMDVGSHLRT
ncbi:MAG: type II toxin-antitoxin system RelE/ParE family toxin [Candidatus Symbiobacter sp.]|nr:type II toxin-antitoxin system RelE/ParE family toxin [Candidatus Symbiobacter sp.]